MRSSMRMRLAALAFGVVALVGLGPVARAAEFVYVAPCLVNCASIGIADGTLVGALIGVNDAAVAPNAVIAQSDLTSFTALFGSLSLSLADLVAFTVVLDATGAAGAAWIFALQNATGTILAINDGTDNAFIAALAGADVAAFGTPGALVRTGVPEPATLLLLGVGLALAGVARRR